MRSGTSWMLSGARDEACSGALKSAVLKSHPKAFFAAFFGVVALGIATIATAHLALARMDLITAPPITATNCIDEKLLFLRHAPLAEARLIAVGSSAAWRNLDMEMLSRELNEPAINTAPCYLFADQTAFWAEVMARRAPHLETLLVVFHIRDFARCNSADTEVFDVPLAAAYLEGWLPEWVPYATGFRPKYLLREARRIAVEGSRHGYIVEEDGLGSSILAQKGEGRSNMRIDRDCFRALQALEAVAAEHAVRLVVATVPTMPSWAAERDPDGTILAGWRNDLRAGLNPAETVFIDGSRLTMDDEQFADPIHLLYPHHRVFTAFIVESMKSHRADRASP